MVGGLRGLVACLADGSQGVDKSLLCLCLLAYQSMLYGQLQVNALAANEATTNRTCSCMQQIGEQLKELSSQGNE